MSKFSDNAFEQDIFVKLLIRGFRRDTLLNNRGLIGAVIDETILTLAKQNPTRDERSK